MTGTLSVYQTWRKYQVFAFMGRTQKLHDSYNNLIYIWNNKIIDSNINNKI